MDNNMIGQRIKEQRLIKNLTQKQLAVAAKINGNISELENNKYLPSAETLLNISKVLDCSIEWILTGENQKSNNLIPGRLSDILLSLEKLSDDKLSEVRKFIDFKLYEQAQESGVLSTSRNGKECMEENSVTA